MKRDEKYSVDMKRFMEEIMKIRQTLLRCRKCTARKRT
jgi:hypothetical protein